VAGERKRDEESPSGPETFIDQGFSVVRGLRSESKLAHDRGSTAQTSASKNIHYGKSQILESTADRIQGDLTLLKQRLSALDPTQKPKALL
jgi:hypothetical protein